MTEDWFEDELPWLGPPPQLPPQRDRSRPVPERHTPPRRLPTTMPVRASAAAAIPFPPEHVPPRRPTAAVPPFVRIPQNPVSDGAASKWIGVALIMLAGMLAFAAIMRESRNDREPAPAPVAQLVIPAATDPSTGDPLAGIVPNPAFSGKVICLDAAHGGFDRGFRRTGDTSAPAMEEALYTAAYARELAGQLGAMGFTVVLTRDGDVVRNSQFQDVNRDSRTRENAETDADAQRNALLDEMQARIDYCNDQRANLLVSLHFDGSGNPGESGYAIWYAEGRVDTGESQRLAESIDRQLAQALGATGYPVVDGGVQSESVAVTRGNQMVYDSLFMITGARDGLKDPSRMPGIVADLLTISNTEDARLLASGAGRTAIVSAVAQAIGAYFDTTAANG